MKYLFAICFISNTFFLFGQSNTFSSNLPIVLIDTDGKTIPVGSKISGLMKIIFNGEGNRNTINDISYNYDGYIGIKLRGNSSLSFDQKQYTVETRDLSSNNLNVSLLNMPKENDWVLHAPYNDISLIRNVLAYHLWSEMGHWGPRTRMTELFLNNKYQGVYVLTETIKRDDNRLKIAKLNYSDTSGIEITGGYIMRIDASNSENDITFRSKVPGIGLGFDKTVTWLYHYPDPKNIHPRQQAYIHNYIDTVELLVQSDNFDDPVNGYSKYLSLQSFIDYFIHTELTLNPDGYKRSAYFYKEKSGPDGTKGKFKAGPVWDFNLAFGICNFCKGNQMNVWAYTGCETLPVPLIWKRLWQDPDFKNAVGNRYKELRGNILSDSYLHTFIDAYAELLNEAQLRHFEKWNDLLTENGVNPGGIWGNKLWFSAYRVSSYVQEIEILKKWLSDRLKFLDDNLKSTYIPTISANEKVDFNNIFVFPNPTSDVVIVESSRPVMTIEIFNIYGKKIAEKAVKNSERIILPVFAQFPAGFYMLRIIYEDGNQITETVLKR